MNETAKINPTTPEKQVAAFAVELDKLLYRFSCEFDIAPEDYAATLMQCAEEVLGVVEPVPVQEFQVSMVDGPAAGEVLRVTYPEDYDNSSLLYFTVDGVSYRLVRSPTGRWRGCVV